MRAAMVAMLALLASVWARAQGDALEQARATARAGQHAAAIVQLERILERQPGDLEARLEYARVLSWAGRYRDALRAYDEVLRSHPDDEEPKVGRARVLYWSGRLDEAAGVLRALRGEEARLLLAQVERARGHNDRALAALQGTSGGASLRESIRQELRPVLRMGWVVEDDRDAPQVGAASTVRAARSSASLEFSLHPDVRMKLSGTLTQATTSSPGSAIYGADAQAFAGMAEIKLKPAHWLDLNVGAGWGTTGGADTGDTSRHQHFLYTLHPVVRWRGLRLDVAATRGLGDYTPLAIYNNVIEQRETLAASYAWKGWRLGGEYWHAGYSLRPPDMGTEQDTHADGGAAFLTGTLHRGERLLAETGARYEAYAFDATAAAIPAPGFFTPRSYQRTGGTGHVWWRPHKRLEAEVSGLLGVKRFFLFDSAGAHGFDLTGSFESKLTLALGRVQPFLAYGFSSAETAAAAGSADQYKVHVFGIGMRVRF